MGPAETKQTVKVAYCEHHKRLLNEFLIAIQDVVRLNAQQSQAVIAGDEDFTRFDVLLACAQRKKNAAKYALLQHIEDHGC